MVSVVPVEWGDQDSFGHVNNAVYFRWCETARVHYLERIGVPVATPGDGIGPILAAIACNFRQPVTYPDTIYVGARVTRIGNSSFRMEHKLVSRSANVVVADGDSTVVHLDYGRQKALPLPESLRQAIARLEGRPI